MVVCSDSVLQLSAGLKALSELEGQIYGEVSIEAGNILRFAQAAPFQGRVSALRAVGGGGEVVMVFVLLAVSLRQGTL